MWRNLCHIGLCLSRFSWICVIKWMFNLEYWIFYVKASFYMILFNECYLFIQIKLEMTIFFFSASRWIPYIRAQTEPEPENMALRLRPKKQDFPPNSWDIAYSMAELNAALPRRQSWSSKKKYFSPPNGNRTSYIT